VKANSQSCSVVRVGCPITGRLAVRFPPLSLKKIGKTVGGVSVHLPVTAEVPLSKAPYPHAPVRCEWLPTAPVYGICLYECVTLCMCMCVNRCQPGWVKSGGQILWICVTINLILIIIIWNKWYSVINCSKDVQQSKVGVWGRGCVFVCVYRRICQAKGHIHLNRFTVAILGNI